MIQPAPSVALIGCGQWGQNLARNLQALGALRLVCDASARARERAAELAPRARIVSDPDSVLTADIDAVVVATPSRSHFALTAACLQAGKDVLVEKPLALSHDEGAELVALAERHERILMVGHLLEYHPGIRRLLALVRAGELGQLRYIASNRLGRAKRDGEKNVLWSFAPHDLAIILRLMDAMPCEVSACAASYTHPPTADVAMTHLLYHNGARAHVYTSWLHPDKERRLTVIGSKKTASFDDVRKELRLYDQPDDTGTPPATRGGHLVPFSAEEPLRLECEAFLTAIHTRQPPLTDGAAALPVLQLLDLAQRSLTAHGTPFPLPMEPLSVVQGAGV